MHPLHRSALVLSAAALLVSAAAVPATAAVPDGAGAILHLFDPEVLDSGFESPVVPPPAPFTMYAAGQSVGPWAVGGDTVDLVSDRLWDAAEGDQSLDLNGIGPGSVSQRISTLPLTSYVVTFELAGNPGPGPDVKTGELLVDGAVLTSFSFDTAPHDFRSMGYEKQTAVFTTLLDTSVTLTFASTNPSAGGPVIDDVRVRSCLLVLCPHTHPTHPHE
ncbi:DUF642 domain-containing protein [uncultured Streptomyces sp.]|uniref:DUF642 domain-containing protein n=1 Tax=uncultured Streptomyces sp. TaxID=174707 RepID=UPI0026293268|nr:DUF642 domain-containing protein [uncultured Streptomyces sp.]